jgi:predicted dithiol-disulfide oxidoreductase (DUF899 family)/AraC-like DNA-binding protein
MPESERTEREYLAAVSRVLEYIQAHLDDELTPGHLANVACFSRHHFHRMFRAVVGESVMDHVRRLRLERAAHQLKTQRRPVGQIALDAGYGAQEAFTRIFQAYFGVAPQEYRTSPVSHLVPATCGVHFGPAGFTPLRPAIDPFLLREEGLCPIHREHADRFEENWERLLDLIRSFGSTVFPSTLRAQSTGQRHAAEELFLMSTTTEIDTEITNLEKEVEKAKQRLAEARRRRPREEVQDYTFKDFEGRDVRLSELFGDKDDLVVVHNMGTGCSYCTMWADGFTGLVPHLSDRAAFVVISPDKPEVQKRFAEKRNWNFRMVSVEGTTFNQDLGFYDAKSTWIPDMPGVSTFRRDPDGKMYRIAKANFGPGDDFCAVWPVLDLLENGPNNWEPKYFYKGENKPLD